VDAADAFVRVAAADDEARDLAVDFAVEVGEDSGGQLCAVSVGECWGGLLQLTSMRRLDRLS
jgi:hypothetical protein